MNRNNVLDNVVNTIGKLGQSLGTTGDGVEKCVYFPDNHPGCAIGCQPGFREKFKGKLRENDSLGGAMKMSDPGFPSAEKHNKLTKDLWDFFDIADDGDDGDVDFLQDLQELHDYELNWRLGGLRKECVDSFRKKWSL